jgi:hypothetical protein
LRKKKAAGANAERPSSLWDFNKPRRQARRKVQQVHDTNSISAAAVKAKADITTTVDRSNSLADLAARIKAEHEASTLAVKRGLAHAISAGRLLTEAKAVLRPD